MAGVYPSGVGSMPMADVKPEVLAPCALEKHAVVCRAGLCHVLLVVKALRKVAALLEGRLNLVEHLVAGCRHVMEVVATRHMHERCGLARLELVEVALVTLRKRFFFF